MKASWMCFTLVLFLNRDEKMRFNSVIFTMGYKMCESVMTLLHDNRLGSDCVGLLPTLNCDFLIVLGFKLDNQDNLLII